MKIIIENSKKLARLKEEFSQFFPFLTLEFLESDHSSKVLYLDGITIGKFRKKSETETLTIFPEMSVSDLEKILHDNFGLPVQVLRKSGAVWLKTTHSNSWSLEHQNKQGEIVSAHLLKQNENNRKKE